MELHEEIVWIIMEAGRSMISAALPWKSFFPLHVSTSGDLLCSRGVGLGYSANGVTVFMGYALSQVHKWTIWYTGSS